MIAVIMQRNKYFMIILTDLIELKINDFFIKNNNWILKN